MAVFNSKTSKMEHLEVKWVLNAFATSSISRKVGEGESNELSNKLLLTTWDYSSCQIKWWLIKLTTKLATAQLKVWKLTMSAKMSKYTYKARICKYNEFQTVLGIERWSTCRDDMEETGILLITDRVAGPTSDYTKLKFWLGWITQYTIGATTAEQRLVHRQCITTTGH